MTRHGKIEQGKGGRDKNVDQQKSTQQKGGEILAMKIFFRDETRQEITTS